MNKKFSLRQFSAVTLLTAFSLCSALGVKSAPNAEYQLSTALYQAGKYSQALTAFEKIARANPTDATAHYYIGLCCQSLLQGSRAAKEYQYVAATSRNPQLRQMAQKALQGLSKYKTSSSGSNWSSNNDTLGLSLASPAARDRAAAASRWAATASLRAGPNVGTPRVSRVKKVIEFYTSWCHVCNEFASTFEETKNRYAGRIEFQQLNAEDGANAEQTSKYAVKAYPTLIYLDGSGNVLRRTEGAPMGPRFANMIESL